MASGNELALYGFVSLVAVLFVLMIGPLGLVAIPFVLIVAGFAKMSAESDAESAGPVNCSGCGAPNEPGAEVCQYCDATI